MITAHVAKILAGQYNKQFNSLFDEIGKLALKQVRDLNLNLSYYKWIEELGFETFKEVMTAFGYEVYNNQNSYKIRW